MSHSLEQRGGGSRVPHMVRVGAIALCAALAVTTAAPRPASTFREWLLSATRFRWSPGRLAEENGYRPWRGSAAVLEDLTRPFAQRRPRTAAPVTQLDSAVQDLIRGNTSRAIAGFDLASLKDATIAVEALADLSAAYLLRWSTDRNCLDLLRAVNAAERGLALAPGEPVLLFNRATALSELGTRTMAARAWEELLSAQDEDGWRAEAAGRLREARRQTDEEEWQRMQTAIASGLAPREVESATLRFPWSARAFAEEKLLPQWAAYAAAGDAVRAERQLTLASEIGDSLQRAGRDELLPDAIHAIRRTMSNGSADEQASLLSGLRDFGAGAVEYEKQNLTTAAVLFARAERALTRAGNPLAFWACFYQTTGSTQRDPKGTLSTLNRLLARIPAGRYPALEGRIGWIAGTADKVQGNLQSSIAHYEAARRNLQRSGGSAAAFVDVLLAESYTVVGEYATAWDMRRSAFRDVPSYESPRRNIAMWTEAKEALLRQGHLSLAGPLLDEAAVNAERWGQPLGRVSAYLDRAQYRMEVGRRDEAFADLQRAKRALSKMEKGDTRDQMAAIALVTEGVIYLSVDPARAASLLRDGLQDQRAVGTKFETMTYAATLGEAELARGAPGAATTAFEEAVATFEHIRSTVDDPVARMQAFRRAQPAFDRLIELHATGRGADPEQAFHESERARARVFLELQSARSGKQAANEPFVRLNELTRIVPHDVALVSYAILPSQIVVWVVQNGHSRQLVLPKRRVEVDDAVERLRLEIASDAGPAAVRRAAASLYDILIRPLKLSCTGDCGLIVIPDRRVAHVPFCVLFDRESGQYLIEQRTVAIAASATLLARGSREREPSDDGGPLSASVFGVSAEGTYGRAALSALPEAPREAERVAELYPGATLLLGPAATVENFRTLSLSSSVIQFSGHAVADLEVPRRSVLMFARPSGEGLDAMPLGELLDVNASRRNTRLVVLSACGAENGMDDDREGLLGLAGAFTAAGVDEVLASPLDVNDDRTASLMVAFHRRYQQHHSAATAFRNAVLGLLRNGSPEARSPAAWGRFSVIAGSLK